MPSEKSNITNRQRHRIVDRIDTAYGGTDWRKNPEYVAKYDKAVRAAEARNALGPVARPTLEDKAANRNLGETPKSKIAQSEMADVPRQTMAEELSKGDSKLAAELEKQQLSTAEKMGLERRAQVERRIIEGKSPEGTLERRSSNRRQDIEEIKRLKGELAADEARRANPRGRDTLVRNVPKIEERISQAQTRLLETAPGPSVSGGRMANLSRLAGRTTKGLGVLGQAANVVEHWRAANVVNTEENKDAPWMNKFAAYSERVLGMPAGSTGRAALPSEARAANQL